VRVDVAGAAVKDHGDAQNLVAIVIGVAFKFEINNIHTQKVAVQRFADHLPDALYIDICIHFGSLACKPVHAVKCMDLER